MIDHPLLDPRALERLQEWGGEALVERMIELFFEQGTIRLEELRAAVEVGAMEQAERAAHSLKSSAGNLGAERLRSVAGALEAQAVEGRVDEVERLAAVLARSYDETVAELERLRPGIRQSRGE